jgi:hypothetical protein
MAKKLIERDRPGIIPDDPDGLIQFLYDELWRIAAAMENFIAGVTVEEFAAAVPIGNPGALYPLFVGIPATIDVPGGNWDQPTGTWEAPATGFYSINLICQVQGLAAPGNQDYVVNLNLEINGVIVYTASNSGNDSYPLSCSIAFTGELIEQDIIGGSVQLVHGTKVETVPAQFNFAVNLVGQSGAAS